MTPSYSKTSFFVHPHASEKPALSKIFTLKRYLFGDGFNLIRVDRTPNYKYPDSCGRGVNHERKLSSPEASSTRPTGHWLYDV